MIVTAFLVIVYKVLEIILYPILILADVALDSGVGASISNATHYLANLNDILPITTIMSVFTSLLLVETAIAVYKTIMWVVRRLPTQS